MDESLQAECDAILSDPSALEEEQIDQISAIIQRFYAAKGRVLASSDLDALVLNVLWRHRDGGGSSTSMKSSGNSVDSSLKPLESSKKSIFSSIVRNGSPTLHKKKVVRGKFAVPMPMSRPASLYANPNNSGASVGSGYHGEFGSIPSTRSGSPDSVYNSNATGVIGTMAPISTYHQHTPTTANTIPSSESVAGFEGPDFAANMGSPDFAAEFRNYSPFQIEPGFYDDDDDKYRPLTIQQQQQQQQQDTDVSVSLQQTHAFEYGDGLQVEPTFDFSPYSYDGDTTQTHATSFARTGESTPSSSSPATSASSFSNIATAAAAVASASTVTTQTPTASTTPTLSSATPTSTLPLVDSMSSPFDHIRAALALPAASNLTDTEITAALERNGYDILVTLTSLFDKLTGRAPQQPQQPVKVQTIGPAYSVQATNGGPAANKEHNKVPTVCRYFLTTGQCLRPDCRFTHDLSATVCRYWLQNSCLAGSTCVFLHSIPPEILTRLKESNKGRGAAAILPGMAGVNSTPTAGTPKKSITLKDESEFPSLRLSSSSASDVLQSKKTVTVGRKGIMNGSTSTGGGSGSSTPGRAGSATGLSIKSMEEFPSLGSTTPQQQTPAKSRATRTKTKVRVASTGSPVVASKSGAGRWGAG
ncbi:hypothetical protein V1525DRAFT_175658 [Lipomyces kononenkoae]|uniref:Uncharacterized protein n=1 Tax=Lipomyces kononenkoae TaxID=34357 RepID=A0ACC3TAD7_LIPKO